MLRTVLVLLCLSALAFCATEELFKGRLTPETKLSEGELRNIFAKWIVQFKKPYVNDIKAVQSKFEIFKQNVEKVKLMNANQNETTYGITKFMDMTPEEFKKTYLSHPMNFPPMQRLNYKPKGNLPENFDWRDQNAVSHVKDQGQCGSCWAFSTTGNIETVYKLATKASSVVTLSEQQLVDCDRVCDPDDPTTCDEGCNGGLMSNAFRWIMKNGGIATEASYPYHAYDRKCVNTTHPIGAKISNWTMLPEDEDAIADYLYNHGTISVAINADPLQYYTGGIISCGGSKEMNHGVLLTGFGQTKPWWIFKASYYWKVKNSWGEDWGMRGYFELSRKCGALGVNTFACSAIVDN